MSLTISLRHKITFLALLVLVCFTSINAYAEEEGEAVPTAYVELKPNFIVNHQSEDTRLRYIKAGITIRTDANSQLLIEDNMPLIRDALVMFLSARTQDQVTGAIAREKTRAEAAVAVNEALQNETGQSPVTDILFSSFVTQ
ncbi:flagellar basal body-associated FliL family protein [Marinomonas sp. A79]|uniref:Flagellar protein FliL n=1 Tax=Marinomonas vulgaris TaxID=2823372 RepID=A0ABS5H8B1_9GAMM|nr:flagellar basal body-associated FliL family protein [Marinomonas vulgaris]MBR7887672.1 flagellar basal body-associated FliL family protein [Marinomonas vulgaris]